MAETLDEVARDNAKKAAHRQYYDQLDQRVERHFKSHPELKSGRDFRMNTMRYQVAGYRIERKFDDTFPESPGSPGWFKNNFCAKCGMRKTMCICIRGKS